MLDIVSDLTKAERARGTAVADLLSYFWWPILFVLPMSLIYAGTVSGNSVAVFNIVYLSFAACVALIERWMPHERVWLANDGQMMPDLCHTLLNKGVAQLLITATIFLGLADWLAPHHAGVWPGDWSMPAQVALGLVIVEFGLYWKHRLAHEWAWLWRFHAVHHSVTRLWFFNTGRFHLVDTLTGLMVGMPVLLLIGAPQPVLLLVSAVTAIVGMLTHCNIRMRCGPLNYVFNTPNLHRWHHSKDLREGNRNYGENLMLFDQLFGTYFNSARRPPSDIGIAHPMPATFWGQIKAPFSKIPL